MRVAIHQPNYVPWCGYFAKMLASDVFVFFDDVQLPQGRSYVTRAKIAKGVDSEQWLTAPVQKSGGRKRIDEVAYVEDSWAAKHISTLTHTYAKAAHAQDLLAQVGPAYAASGEWLHETNKALIEALARYLGYEGEFRSSAEFPSDLSADERLADVTAAVGGSVYVSGAGGQKYQQEETFTRRGLSLEVRVFEPVPYERSGWSFVEGLSIVDAVAHLGPGARKAIGTAT
jgi:hypothetical protein